MNYLRRRDRLLNEMDKQSLEAFLITNPIDLFYFTGMELSLGKLLIRRSSSVLIVDGRYLEMCQKHCDVPTLLLQEKLLFELLTDLKELGIDSETTSAQNFFDLQAEANKQKLALRPMKGIIKNLRAIKDSDEVAVLRQAAILGSEGFDYALNMLKEGVREADIALSIEYFWRNKGAKGVAFEPIIAFGEHGSMPHYRAGKTSLAPNQSVLIDIGVLNQHYHSDMTRVVFFGKVAPEIIKIRGIVQEALERACALLKPGITTGELDDAARKFIASCGYGDKFTHSLGHGVGLEIHEFPTIRRTPSTEAICLQEGMVFTIEPGIYLPGVGGVRLEDTVAITATGYENFTNKPYEIYA